MNFEDVNGTTVDERLWAACSELDKEGIEKALDGRADVNVDDGRMSPVVMVVRGDGFWAKCDDEDELKYGEDVDTPKDVLEERCKQAITRKIECLSILLERGANINAAPEHEWSVGFHSVSAEPEVVRFLLENGMDPNLTTEWFGDHWTALRYALVEELINRKDAAIASKLRKIVQLFLEYGAIPFLPDELDESLGEDECCTYEFVPPRVTLTIPSETKQLTAEDKELFAACRSHDMTLALSALEKGGNPNARDAERDFATPLLEAVRGNIYDIKENPTEEDCRQWRKVKRDLAQMLLERGADPNIGEVSEYYGADYGVRTIEANTPLHESAWLSKDVELSKMLLDHGANPNILSSDPSPHTIRDMNDWDYNVDSPIEVKAIEKLLGSYGGCCYYIFDNEERKGLSAVDRKLILGCQRLDYSVVMSAIRDGANTSLHEWGDRCIPVIALNDAPQLLGKRFKEKGCDIEDEMSDFLLYLMGGMKVPIGEREADEIIRACVDNGFEKVLSVMVAHHKYGGLFRARGCLHKIGSWPWECWPMEKQLRMMSILRGEEIMTLDECEGRMDG